MYNIYLRLAYPNELYHHGIKGQKWGTRRFQNPDGSLTPAGKKRYLKDDGTLTRKGRKESEKSASLKQSIKTEQMKNTPYSDYMKSGFKDTTPDLPGAANMKKAIKIGKRVASIGTSIGANSDTNVSVTEMNRAAKVLEKNGDALYNEILKDASRFNVGEVINGGKPVPGKPDDFRITRFNKDGGLLGECICDIRDIDGEFFGEVIAEFDPNNGKLIRTSLYT